MKLVAPNKKLLNVSQLSDLAQEATQISETAEVPALPLSKAVVTQSTNDPLDVQLYADANNVSPGTTEELPVNKSGDQYMPIILDLGGLGQPQPTTTNTTLTEEEKRKRTIIIASIILLVLIVMVAVYSLKKGK